jgi:ribokinase
MGHKIIVVGSSNTDMVIKSKRIPVPGETILGGDFLMNPGGKGANQAVAAARLGGDVTFIARTGNDMFGKRAVELYKKEGINTKFITTDEKEPSGVALILVDEKGENCISVSKSANEKLTQKEVEVAKDLFEKGDIVLMQLETPLETIEYTAQMANEKGLKVILNPAPARELPASLLKNVYMVIPNETEAEILSGVKVTDLDSAKKAADVISAKGVDIVLITIGKRGAFVKEGNNYEVVPTYKTVPVDTTAAGDTFCGALCVALSEGKSIKDAVKFANRSASISVTHMGAQSSVPYRKEIDEIIAKEGL